MTSLLLPAAIFAVMLFELLWRAAGVPQAHHAAIAAMLAVIVLALPRLGMREAYLLALSAVLSGVAVARFDDPLAAVIAGSEQAVFLMAFLFLLTLLNDAASTSDSVQASGAWLTHQPPGRRYSALFWGTNLIAVLFNLGIATLLSPLIKRGVAARSEGDAIKAVLERRQYSAVLRGFAWCVVWSPTALAPLALMELIEGIDRLRWTLLGFGIATVVFLAGWLEDRLRFAHLLGRVAHSDPPKPPVAALLRFGVTAVLLFAVILSVVLTTGETIALGLMVACPLVAAGWIAVQHWRGEGASPVGRFGEIARDSLPGTAPVAVTLACSGFIGRMAAALVPAGAVAEWMGLAQMPDWLLLTAIPVAICALAWLALSPIMLAVFFGSLFGSLPQPVADPTLVALAISIGWALSMTFSPFATIVLLLARLSGHPALRLSVQWNSAFTAAAGAIVLLAFLVLTGGA